MVTKNCNHIQKVGVQYTEHAKMYTDQELINLISQKDESAIKYFINEYKNYLYTISISVLRNKEEAEEATHDSILKILKAIPKYKLKGKLTTWMYTVAYRTSLDYIKKRKRTTDLNVLSPLAHSYIQNDILKKEKTTSIFQLIDRLPPEDAGLVRLYYLEEQSIKEISQFLNLTESNIKIKLYRVRKELFKQAKKLEYFSEYFTKN